MYYDDHPPPHFYAIYGEYEAKIAIDTLEIMGGKQAAEHDTLSPIAPLE
jgi:hypothetical protein